MLRCSRLDVLRFLIIYTNDAPVNMKNLICNFGCFLFFISFTVAQKKAIFNSFYIEDEVLHLLYKKNDSIKFVSYEYQNDEFIIHEGTRNFLNSSKAVPFDKFIPSNKIRKGSSRRFYHTYLADKKYVVSSNDNTYNSYFFSNGNLIYYEKKAFESGELFTFLGSYIIKDIDGYPFLFLIADDGYSFATLPFFKKKYNDLKNSSFTISEKEDIIKKLSYNDVSVKKVNHKYGVYKNEKQLLPPVFDHIQLGNPVITKRKGNIALHNLLNEPFGIENIRAAHFKISKYGYPKGVQILKGNTVFWTDLVGNIIERDSLPKLDFQIIECDFGHDEDPYYVRELKKVNDSIFFTIKLMKFTTNFKEELIKTKQVKTFKKNTIDSLYFLCRERKGKYCLRTNTNYLISKTGNKYRLYDYNHKDFELLEAEKKCVVLEDLDKEPKGDLVNDLVFIQKNGLKGYYPLHKEPKYKELGAFDNYFTRFTLPNGQKGWLDLYGNEYLYE